METQIFFAFLLGFSLVAVVSTQAAFTCPGLGIYADPLDCSGFYSCDKNGKAARLTCGGSGHYDADLESCVSGSCPAVPTTTSTTVLPTTTTVTTMDPTITDSITSTTSTTELPTEPATSTTEPAPKTEPQTVPTEPETPTTPSTTITPTPTFPSTTITSTTTRQCTRTGQTFPDPTTCRKFLRCDSSLNLVSSTCGAGFFQKYDPNTGGCVFALFC